jgi:hypothetical protein
MNIIHVWIDLMKQRVIFLILDNHYRCPTDYAQWMKSCDPSTRRRMVDEREYNKLNNFLYT